MSERLQVLELSLGGLVTVGVGLVEDLGRAKPTAVVDVGRHREPALGQLAQEVDLAGVLGPQLKRLLLNLVGQRDLISILGFKKLLLPGKPI